MITIGGKTPETIFIASKEVAAISIDNEQVWVKTQPTPPTPTVDYFYVENEYNGNNKITITTSKYDAHDDDPDAGPLDMTKCGTSIEWSKDLTNWTTETLSDQTPVEINMSQGEKVYFRNDTGKLNYLDTVYFSEWNSSIGCNYSFSVGGDIYTLIDYTGTNIGNRYDGCLHSLFFSSPLLVDVTDLDFTENSLVPYEFHNTFCGTRFTTPPTLPATTLASNCYSSMFGSSAITSAPALPATTLYGYCYSEMFMGCSSLNEITISADDISADDCLLDWLDGVANSGTFHNLGLAIYPTDSTSGIPTGWTEVNS